jgi:CBS domain containing-hemolysin-like protein
MLKLSLHRLNQTELRIPGADRWYIRAQDPAVSVMTDFREHSSVTVAENATIDAALDHMKHAGVRCAFVIDKERRVVLGLVTAYEIMGEKPMRHMQALGMPRSQVLVRDLMVRVADWHTLNFENLNGATVASLNQILEETGHTHLPVTETSVKGEVVIRGVFSAAKIRRLLVQ